MHTAGPEPPAGLSPSRQGSENRCIEAFLDAVGGSLAVLDAAHQVVRFLVVGDVDVLLSVNGGTDKSDVWLIKIDNPFTTEDDGDTDPYRSGASNDPHMDLDTAGANLTVNWSMSDALTLTSR